MTKIRVAAVQAGSVVFDRDACLDKVEEFTGRAAADGAQLTVFPEAFVSGYPRGMSFGLTIGNRTLQGRDHFARYWDSAIDVPGPAVDRLADIAATQHQHLVVGVIEREGGTLYCTVLFFAPFGYPGKRRKLMPTAAERGVWGFGDGSTLPVFETDLGRIGAVICWENYMPLLRMSMYGKGIEIYCAPTADGRETWLSTMRHVAMEGRCFVVSCNQYTELADLPEDIENEVAQSPTDIVSSGGSCIIGPLGEVIAGPARGGEQILIADLDLAELPKAKFDFDAVGHYARPDVFTLSVNERPQLAVNYD